MNKIVILCLIFLSACSSLSKGECQTTNFTQLGEADGRQGYSGSRFDEYLQVCREHGIGIADSHENYLKGLKLGLKNYCTYENGYRLGNRGKKRHLDCENMNDDFRSGYAKGSEDFKKREAKKAAITELVKRLGTKTCNSRQDCIRVDGAQGNCIPESAYLDTIKERIYVNVCRY